MCRHAKRLPVALLALLAPSPVVAFSVPSIEGGGASSHLGVAGGADLHIVGTDLGDPFNPPTVLIGNNPNPAQDSGWDLSMPATPRLNSASYSASLAAAVDLSQTGGFVGITLNGVSVLSCYGGTQYGRCVDFATSASNVRRRHVRVLRWTWAPLSLPRATRLPARADWEQRGRLQPTNRCGAARSMSALCASFTRASVLPAPACLQAGWSTASR